MPAVIESSLYTAPPPGGALVPGSTQQNSRNDLRKGYHVVCHSVHEATTYSWTLAFAPASPGSAGVGTPFDGTVSGASLLPPEGSTSRDCKFNVDFEGAYLLRLVVDAGLPTEDTQFVRLRMLTHFADIKLVSAGERRDQNGVIPVDASPEGWANDQNANFQRILVLLRRLSTSGRVLFVDANRGRDNAHDQNDPDALVHIPGPDAADRERTGIKTQAEAFGDFYTINDAIAYAAAAVTRSEAAPSADNPYFIVIYPGFYEEDLNLAAHVHLISAYHSGFQTLGETGLIRFQNVLVRTANAGGGTHTFNPGDATAQAALVGLLLQNTDDVATPVLRVQGGIVYLHNSTVEQRGNAANQGECIRIESADPVTAQVALVDSDIWSDADADDERWAVRLLGPGAVFDGDGIFLRAKSGILANENLDQLCDVNIQRSIFTADRPYRGCAGAQVFDRSEILVNTGSVYPAIEVTNFGQPANAKPGTLTLQVSDCHVSGDISFATAVSAGATTLHYRNVTQLKTGGKLLLPDAPGELPGTTQRGAEAYSLTYVTDFAKPTLGPGGPATLPLAARSPFPNVQETIDLLMLATFPLGAVPFYSLESAYNGLASLNPFTIGGGLGRSILADDGAVQITGAVEPLAMANWRKDGGLQVEGIIDIGPLVGGADDDTVAEIGGSEIHLNPNPMGAGPFIQLGRVNWPNDIGSAVRGLPAAIIQAGTKLGAPAPGGRAPFHLNLRTDSLLTSGTGEVGRVVIQGGHGSFNQAAEAPSGGSLYFQAGSNDDALGLGVAGDIWLVPGTKTGGSGGRVRLAGSNGVSVAHLRAANPFVGGVAGKLFMATPGGVEVFAITAGMNLAAVVNLVLTTSKHLTAMDTFGNLHFFSREFGPNGDVLYVGDDQGGALNVALGDLRASNGAFWTAGAFGDSVAVSCPAPDVFKVHGTIEADAATIPGLGAGVLGPYVRIDTLNGPNPGAPYSVVEATVVVGVMTLAGPVWLQLPDSPTMTKHVIVKDEEFNALANNITVFPPGGKTIEGQPQLVIATNGGSASLYRGVGGNWFIY